MIFRAFVFDRRSEKIDFLPPNNYRYSQFHELSAVEQNDDHIDIISIYKFTKIFNKKFS